MNNLHKEFRFFSWQHFSTQSGVVKISLQAVSFYTMIYFRVYWKELGGKIHCRHPGRISISFYSRCENLVLLCLGHSDPTFVSLCMQYLLHGIFWIQVFWGVYWSLSTNWIIWQVLLGSLHDRSSHRSHGLMKREKRFEPNCGGNKHLPFSFLWKKS